MHSSSDPGSYKINPPAETEQDGGTEERREQLYRMLLTRKAGLAKSSNPLGCSKTFPHLAVNRLPLPRRCKRKACVLKKSEYRVSWRGWFLFCLLFDYVLQVASQHGGDLNAENTRPCLPPSTHSSRSLYASSMHRSTRRIGVREKVCACQWAGRSSRGD